VVAAAYFLYSFELTKLLSTICTDFSPFSVDDGTFRKWNVFPPITTCASFLTATFLKSAFTASFDTEKPAPSTAVLIASKLTGFPALKIISNEEDLMSGFTDSTKGSLSSAMLIALVHMAQVKPAAVRFADRNWAVAEMEKIKLIIRNIFFITSVLESE